MLKWKIISFITIVFLIIFFIYVLSDAVNCMNMYYPHPMLGTEASNWIEQFTADLLFIMIIWGIPLVIDIVLMIISIIKVKKVKIQKKLITKEFDDKPSLNN